MSRPTCRRTMTLESLEKREVLTAAPSGMSQYALELLNMARTNPSAAAQWLSHNIDPKTQSTLDYYGVNLSNELAQIAATPAQPPLAWSDPLSLAATGQSQDQAVHNYQGHNGSDGSNLNTRLDRVGYTNPASSGEDAFAYADSVDHAMKAFLLDWGVSDKGHRRNILQPGVSAQNAYTEVGVGITATGNDGTDPSKVGPNVITIDFGKQQAAKAELLGVAYNDPNHTNFYAPNEGRGDVVIQAQNLATGQITSTQTASAGGYQVALDPGTYRVSGLVNGQLVRSQDVSVGTTNVKVDFDLSNPWSQPVPVSIPTPTPTAPPAPVIHFSVPVPSTPPTPVVTPPAPPKVVFVPPTVVYTPTQANTTTVDNAVTPVNNAGMLNPLSWITSWAAYRDGKRIN